MAVHPGDDADALHVWPARWQLDGLDSGEKRWQVVLRCRREHIDDRPVPMNDAVAQRIGAAQSIAA